MSVRIYVRASTKEQLNQRLIGHKNQEKRGGIFSKLFR
jgi:DNA invertase Pin-like site-specific DNA recombinase